MVENSKLKNQPRNENYYGIDIIRMRQNLIRDRNLDNLMQIKELIKEGKENEAFESFIRAHPTCLPFRSLINLRKKQL